LSSRADREFVTLRADSRCEYCRAPEVITGVTFHVEHIIPRSRGGANHRRNYALACIACNSAKSDHLTGLDPKTGEEITLFDPRRDRWDRHFRFVPAALEIHGLTSKGRATVERLQLNHPRRLEARALWCESEIFP
jgi:hypothetical protein